VIGAIAQTAQWQSASEEYATPSMALMLGHNMQKQVEMTPLGIMFSE